jgi:hypothetical protein
MAPNTHTEQTPLLNPAESTTLYSTPTPAGGVVVEDDKHYNLVGLSKGSFWILVRELLFEDLNPLTDIPYSAYRCGYVRF